MKRQTGGIAALVVVLFSVGAHADRIKDHFRDNLNQPSLDAFAEDVGTLVGGGSFHTGAPLSPLIGIDVGMHAPFIGVQDEDTILREGGSTANSTWAQVEWGVPFNLNLIGRGGLLYGAPMYGAGLRWGIFDGKVPPLPALSVEALYGIVNHDFFNSETASVNAVLSFNIPIVHPYIGAGYDHTKLDPTSEAFFGLPSTVSRSLSSSRSGTRVEAGVNLSLIPFTYITLGGGVANGEELYHLALGVKL